MSAVCEDTFGNLWLGNSMVLTRIDPVKNEYTHFQHDPANSASIGANTGILTLLIDPTDKNYLWLGMERGSLQKLDIQTGKFTHYGVGSVYNIFPSDSGFFWLAGFHNLKKKYVVPFGNEPDFLNEILKIIDKEHVDAIISNPEEELLVLSKNKEKIEEKGALLLCPDFETVEICAY